MSFTVYKSSAGSGKTYSLVKEYLKIILKNPSHFKRVLAITFTNKAAEEMKSRIVDTLIQIANVEQLPDKAQENTILLLNDISGTLKIPNEKLKLHATRALELILHNYSDFCVSTIDSFVHGIVRTFAKDLNLSVNFDIELEQDNLLNEAVGVLIAKAGIEEDITQLLLGFIEAQVEAQKNLNIEDEIKGIGAYLFKEESINKVKELKTISVSSFFKMQEKMFAFIKQYKSKLKEEAEAALVLIHQNNIPYECFYYKKAGIANYFKNIASGKIDSIENKNVAKGVENDKWTSDLCSTSDVVAINSIKDRLAQIYFNIKEIALNDGVKAQLYLLMVRNVFSLAVLSEIASIIDLIKTENNVLHISEFNKKIADIVLNEPIPFVYERVGVKYNHIMIDEFQDTSVLQWLNLLPLVENAIAEGGFSMVVGDAKQAIYRWRDGDVEQFVKLPHLHLENKTADFLKKEQTLVRNCITVELNKNYRSRKNIIDFNNSFFETISNEIPEPLREIYANVKQQSDPEKAGGYVQIDFSEKSDKTSFEHFNLEKIFEIITDLTGHKNYKHADITILCRSNNNANVIARYLMSHNINVVSSESLLLYKSPLINFFIALLEFLDNKDNIIACVNIANYISKTKLLNTIPFSLTLKEITSINNGTLKFLKNHYPDFNFYELKKLPLYDLCEALIRIFSLNATTDIYLHFFMDVVFNFTTHKKNNIPDFLKFWNEKSKSFSVIVPEGLNAVRIMTIHKSKGLQFPVVIYPFANEPKKLGKKNMWVDIDDSNFSDIKTFLIPANESLLNTVYKDLYVHEDSKSKLDLINVLYVALTRPVEKLFIISELPGKTAKTLSVNGLLKAYLIAKDFWKNDMLSYSFGENLQATAKKESTAEQPLILENFISRKWQDVLLMKYKSKGIWQTEAENEALRWGNLIHHIMCRIVYADDIDITINQKLEEGFFEEALKDEIKTKISNIISDNQIKKYFEKGHIVLNEKEIMDSDGQMYRPDRIVITHDETALIDYKTGSENEKYKNQVDKYAELIAQMGYKNILKHLIYVDSGNITKW